MTIYKKSACDNSKAEMSSTVYLCDSCGFMTIEDKKLNPTCPQCNSHMTIQGGSESAEDKSSHTDSV